MLNKQEITKPTLFPAPLPDESDYSLISRYHLISGNKSRINTKRILLKYNFDETTKPDITVKESFKILNNISEWLGLPIVTFIEKHTLFNFWKPFCWYYDMSDTKHGYKYHDRIEDILSDSYIQKSISFRESLKIQKCCPKCMKEDVKEYGHTYWHRSHQPPGVYVCYKHKCKLYRQNSNSKWFFEISMPQFKNLKLIERLNNNIEIFALLRRNLRLDELMLSQIIYVEEYACLIHQLLMGNINNIDLINRPYANTQNNSILGGPFSSTIFNEIYFYDALLDASNKL